jgi:Domain of unknown function (DUF1844)
MSEAAGPAFRELPNEDSESRPELPPADFDFLVYSLRLQAELNLGLLPMGASGEENQEPDLDLARHNIDLLTVLQQKTRGNLTDAEQRALDNSVAGLRLRFVEAKGQLEMTQSKTA